MDFGTSLPISTNCKSESHEFMLMIVDYLIKMVNYKPIKVKIHIFGLVKVIINVIICQYDILELFVID